MTGVLQQIAWVAGAALMLATLPTTALLLCLSIAGLAPGGKRSQSRRRNFRLRVLVPAHDEELLIARCVRSVLASGVSHSDFAVYVVADNCRDSTASAAIEAGARVLVRTDPLRKGKGYALNYGFEKVLDDGADGVLVVDADSIVSPDLVGIVSGYLGAGADAVQCRYRVMDRESSVRNRLMDIALLGFNVLRPRGRDRLGLSVGILGNGFALSAATLRSIPYRADSIVEDLEYHIHLVRAGYRVRFADEATVYGEMPAGDAAASSQRSRWEGGRLRMLLEWAPRLTVDLSRGRARCFELLLELATLPLAYQVLLSGVLFAVGPEPLRKWACVQVAVIVFHVAAAASKGDNFPRNLGAVGSAPFYVAWKLALLPQIVRASRPETNWIRTDRKH